MTKVSYPKSLRLPERQTIYTVAQTIYHEGCSVESGHYFALIHDELKTVLIDGSTVEIVNEDDPNIQSRIARAQLCIAIYQSCLHIRSWFWSRVNEVGDCRSTCTTHQVISAHTVPSRPCYVASPGSLDEIPKTPSPPRSPVFRCRTVNTKRKQLIGFLNANSGGTYQHRFLSTQDKVQIAHLRGSGASVGAIASAMHRHKSTVSRFLNSEIARSECPRYTMVRDEKLHGIVMAESISNSSRRLSCLRISEQISRKYGIRISKETVRQIRRIVGFRFLRPIPQCYLTQDHKDHRVAFATEWLESRFNLLRRTPIVFSDESKICLEERDQRLWRIPGECLEGDYISVSQHPMHIMIWGAVSVGYKSPLLWFEETCNKQTYVELLEKNGIFTSLDNIFGAFQYVFQQDNAPPHVARTTLAWLEERAYILPNWPPHSPDLNPIEVMWALVKPKIDVSGVKTAKELFKRTEEAWNSIRQETVDNICSSFEARL